MRRVFVAALALVLAVTLAWGQCVDCRAMLGKRAHPCCQGPAGKKCPMPMPSSSTICPTPDGVLSAADTQAAPELPGLVTLDLVELPSEMTADSPSTGEPADEAAPPGPDLFLAHSSFLI